MSWRIIILNLILPLNLLILMFVLFVQIWFMQFDVNKNGLQASRYLVDPLLEVFSDKPDAEKDVPGWIIMIVLENGKIYYPLAEDLDILQNDWEEMGGKSNHLQPFLAEMASEITNDLSIVSFTYWGQKGICFYVDDLMPSAFRVLQKPRYLTNLFLVTTLLFIMGGGIILNLKRDMEKLILAASRLQNMDFKTPLLPDRENELYPVFRAFEDMRHELLDHREQGLRFMMSLTHDLKTPLTSIRGYLEALKDGVIDTEDEAKRVFDTMLKKSALLEERINEMLVFSKVVSTQIKGEGEIFSAKEWLENLNSFFYEESILNKKSYTFRIDCPENLKLSGLEKQLTRAVGNLYDNACSYTDEKDPVLFTAEYDKDNQILIVRMEDGGPGIPPENREKIFELFYRKDKGRNTRGMGIGLASVKFVADMHGGDAFCHDSSLGGACFEIHLPVKT